ncbi:hypothetical protein A6R70_21530 [Agrobacterium rubi]|nr:hypothetical protein [Agrobacterium rubi]
MEYRLKFIVFSDDSGSQDTFAANLQGKQTYEAVISLYFRLVELWRRICLRRTLEPLSASCPHHV